MSAEPKYTERERIEIERQAFRDGSRWLSCWCSCNNMLDNFPWITGDNDSRVWDEAAKRYPLPKVTRPRVVKDPVSERREWKYEGGRFLTRTMGEFDLKYSSWVCAEYGNMPVVTARVQMWADLMAVPDEEVDADA